MGCTMGGDVIELRCGPLCGGWWLLMSRRRLWVDGVHNLQRRAQPAPPQGPPPDADFSSDSHPSTPPPQWSPQGSHTEAWHWRQPEGPPPESSSEKNAFGGRVRTRGIQSSASSVTSLADPPAQQPYQHSVPPPLANHPYPAFLPHPAAASSAL